MLSNPYTDLHNLPDKGRHFTGAVRRSPSGLNRWMGCYGLVDLQNLGSFDFTLRFASRIDRPDQNNWVSKPVYLRGLGMVNCPNYLLRS